MSTESEDEGAWDRLERHGAHCAGESLTMGYEDVLAVLETRLVLESRIRDLSARGTERGFALVELEEENTELRRQLATHVKDLRDDVVLAANEERDGARARQAYAEETALRERAALCQANEITENLRERMAAMKQIIDGASYDVWNTPRKSRR